MNEHMIKAITEIVQLLLGGEPEQAAVLIGELMPLEVRLVEAFAATLDDLATEVRIAAS